MDETESDVKRRRIRTPEREEPEPRTTLQRLWLKRIQSLFERGGPPQPIVEVKRRLEVLRLRELLSNRYEDLIKIMQASNAHSLMKSTTLRREAFNRWLMERINGGGIDPLLGGHLPTTSDARPSLNAAAEGLYYDLREPFLQEKELPESFANKIDAICSELEREADAAAERMNSLSIEETQQVLATLNANRGCYIFSLSDEGDREAGPNVEPEEEHAVFTLSPSALARLAHPFHV